MLDPAGPACRRRGVPKLLNVLLYTAFRLGGLADLQGLLAS
jgi:hypothetical protein